MIGLTQVRPMTPADLDEVVAIEEASFSAPWSERTFRFLLGRKSACLLVAENETAEIAGYAVAWFAGPEAELGNLAVRPEWRARGLGSTLLEAVLAQARERGAEALFLEVRMSNAAARQLYERAGFSAVGMQPGYYVNPSEDALVMRVDLVGELR
jgi:ribosomal-protein-alanine N-acetyltransferase